MHARVAMNADSTRLPAWCVIAALLLAWVVVLPANAATRAWLSREDIGLGETTTLNIETDQGSVDSPDYAPLRGQFEVTDNTSSRQYQSVNGQSSQRLLFAVALRPYRAGMVQVPALQVGAERTQPLSLLVADRPQAPAATQGGAAVFIETELDTRRPYIQQAVAYTARFFYSVPIRGGVLQPEPRQPDGASLREVGDDVQYNRTINGVPYRVFERHYLLIPEKSGRLQLPVMRFQGDALLDPLDRMFGGDERIQARSAPMEIQVQPLPGNAPQPWLPLHGLSLSYQQAPRALRAGEAATVVLQAQADGASAAQMPALELGKVDGAQVFAEPVQLQERIVDGRPQATARRSFSIVPTRAGTLRIQPSALPWWDANAGQARVASVPPLSLQVEPGAAAAAANAGDQVVAPAASGSPPVPRMPLRWAVLAGACALALLGLLGWWLWQRGRDRAAFPAPAAVGGIARVPGNVGIGDVQPAPAVAAAVANPVPSLAQALRAGDLSLIERAWCAAATPPVKDLDALRRLLADPAQIHALDLLQAARWGGGTSEAALEQLRIALRDGIRWKPPQERRRPLLQPLYPPSGSDHTD